MCHQWFRGHPSEGDNYRLSGYWSKLLGRFLHLPTVHHSLASFHGLLAFFCALCSTELTHPPKADNFISPCLAKSKLQNLSRWRQVSTVSKQFILWCCEEHELWIEQTQGLNPLFCHGQLYVIACSLKLPETQLLCQMEVNTNNIQFWRLLWGKCLPCNRELVNK